MMFDFVRWCRNYLRLCVFFIAALVGLQVPGFKNDYGHALRSAYSEAQLNMAPFERDAEKFFDGSVEKLLAHYQKSDDPVYAKGGENLALLLERENELEAALDDFGTHPYVHLLKSPILSISKQVWNNYTPQIQLDTEALVSSVVFALLVSWTIEALFLMLIIALSRALKYTFKRNHATE